jgi:Holliday junction resolvase RusA-like endonuclease
MSKFIRFFIPGKPEPKGRPRFTRSGRTYTPLKTQEWENTVGLTAIQHKPTELWTGPIACGLVFQLPKPLKHPKKKILRHIVKPDLDNVIKAILDAMEGIIFKGDQQIYRLYTEKIFFADTEVNARAKMLIALEGE